MRTRRTSKAFTLVEILIVVVILGILAAIVVPQFTNATQDAQAGNIKAQLQSINSQLELYKARNNEFPDLADWTQLTDGTEKYLKEPPKNPFNSSSLVGTDPETDGWHWRDINSDGVDDQLGATNFDEATGRITPGVL